METRLMHVGPLYLGLVYILTELDILDNHPSR